VLAAVTSGIAGTGTNIDRLQLQERDTDTSAVTMELQVHNRTHLAHIIKTIRRMPEVQRVIRTIASRTS
jgi:GTP pyrophosphokinase/guanosine-3',5'-bis(diphosphate) 3'-pyrophosphohydrolase